MGKTQVALQLVYAMKEQCRGRSIFWVPAVSEENFEQAYRMIAIDCSIQLNPTEEDPKWTVQRYLSRKAAGRWLLVVDNADDEEILFGTAEDRVGIADYLPYNEDELTLFTTRYRQIAVAVAGKDVVDLQTMTDNEAESFLRNSITQEEILQDGAATTELLTELMHLPLAIAQATAYLNATQISLQEYLSLLKNTENDAISLLSREFRDETRYKSSKHSTNAVATTWLVSFNHIRRSDPVAADLLSFISCVEHKAIPRWMLPKVEPVEQTVHALATLRAYAFVTLSETSEHYDMHRLVHLASKIWLNEQAATHVVFEKTTAHLAEIFPKGDYPDRFIWREYFPHAFRLLDNTRGLDIEARYELCYWLGICLQEDGRTQEAVRWLSECCKWRQSHLPEDDLSRLDSQDRLAMAYYSNGKVQEAVTLLEYVVKIQRVVLKEDDPELLTSQHDPAIVYVALGKFEQSIEFLENVAMIEKRTLTEKDPSRLASQHELAAAYHAAGRIDEAIKLLEHVVSVRSSSLAEDHPDRLASQHDLAAAYHAAGRIDEAIKLLEHVVSVRSSSLAEDHPDRLASQHEFARAYYAAGRVDEAIELLTCVVFIQSSSLAEDHPDRLVSQRALARAFYTAGRVDEAIELLTRVVLIESTSLAEDHPNRLLAQDILSEWHAKQQRHGQEESISVES